MRDHVEGPLTAPRPEAPRTIPGWTRDLAHTLTRVMPDGLRFQRLELRPSPFLWTAVTPKEPNMIQYTEQFEFAAAHRLHCPQWGDERNRDVFGKCNNPYGHGHNYVLEVTVDGTLQEPDGLLMPPGRLAEVVKQRVLERYDHRHLNEETEEFAEINPSVENIAQVIWQRLEGHVEPARLVAVRLYETPKTWAEYRRSDG